MLGARASARRKDSASPVIPVFLASCDATLEDALDARYDIFLSCDTDLDEAQARHYVAKPDVEQHLLHSSALREDCALLLV